MALYNYNGFYPVLGENVFIAPSADVIGKSFIKQNANIWFGCVIRGDIQEIHIGENTNIQDLCMLHVIEDRPLLIGNNVSVGHKATLHSCIIEDSCLIGMGATILDGAVIGKNSVVAAGSVVPPGKIYPEGSMIMGAPALIKRGLTEQEKKDYANHYKTYLLAKNEYLDPQTFSLISGQ